MDSQAIQPATDTDKIVAQLLQHTSKDQIRSLVEAAVASSGQAIGSTSLEPGDELCPLFRFPFPFPPRFDRFLATATKLGSFRVFPMGTPDPFEIIVETRPRRFR